MDQIAVVAKFVAKAGSEQALEQALANVVKPTQAEEGCIMYLLHRSISNPSEFWFLEQWESQASLDRHAQSSHIKTLRGLSPSLVSVEPLIVVLDPLAD
jgi:quinol monooxygenase YgiN